MLGTYKTYNHGIDSLMNTWENIHLDGEAPSPKLTFYPEFSIQNEVPAFGSHYTSTFTNG